jgi:hypothetical protein
MYRVAKTWMAIVATLLLAPATALAVLPPEMADLVKVKSKRLAEVYLLPGTDFKVYKKVMIDPAQVSFNKNWQKDMKRSASLTSGRISDDQAKQIAEAARSAVGEIFQEAFKKAGYELVTAPAADVLRLTPAVINLYVNAPAGGNATRTYAMEAGEATLVLAVRDSVSGALIGMALDKRDTRTAMSGPVLADSVTNRGEFEVLFRRWAEIAVKGFNELREAPPIAAAAPKKK